MTMRARSPETQDTIRALKASVPDKSRARVDIRTWSRAKVDSFLNTWWNVNQGSYNVMFDLTAGVGREMIIQLAESSSGMFLRIDRLRRR